MQVKKKDKSYLATLFTVELDSLGQKGFTDWLQASFSGKRPAPLPPHFDVPELQDNFFASVFAEVVPELDPDKRQLVQNSVRVGLEKLPNTATFEGLFTFARLAEAAGLPTFGKLVAKNIRHRLPTKPLPAALPNTEVEVYSLRETLECGFRLAFHEKAAAQELSNWAYHFSLSDHFTAPSLKPALAPLVVLARFGLLDQNLSAARSNLEVKRLEAVLWGSFYGTDDPFENFYTLSVAGERYPFDVSGVIENLDYWLSGPAHVVKSRLTSRFRENPLSKPPLPVNDPASTVLLQRIEREAALHVEDENAQC